MSYTGAKYKLELQGTTWANLEADTLIDLWHAIQRDHRVLPGEYPAPPSCATCRWAVANRMDDGQTKATLERYPLTCARAEEATDDGTDTLGDPIADAAPMGAWCESAFRGALLVQPHFGCVQWEGKESPMPGAP